MDYNTILKQMRNEKNITVDEIKMLDESESKELKETKKTIEEKYSGLKEKSFGDLGKKTTDIYNYCKLIEKYSTMDSDIFYVITELISLFEGEPYVLERIDYHKDKSTPSEVWDTFMIMSQNTFNNIKNPKYVRERYFNHLLKNGLAITIIEEWGGYFLPDYFTFYKADSMGRLNQNISFKGFPYIKEFIDYIINYRIENNIEELLEEDMQKLKDEFILLNVNKIQNNYQIKQQRLIQQNTENITSEFLHKQKILKRIVRKIEDNK